MKRKRKTVSKKFQTETIDVIYDPMQHYPSAMHPGVKRRTELLKKGSRQGEEAMPLKCDMIFDGDVPIEMDDGTVIFCDIIRPVTEEKVPAIISYSPYGKHIHSLHLPWGVPENILSNLQKQEGPDPGFWVPNGYAVIQPDTRGAFYSHGDAVSFGRDEGKDGKALVEWLAEQDWCNGKVGMSGNSYLAITQFLTAAEKPEHLAAIAPWEGFVDVYRDTLCRGGIPNAEFQKRVDSEREGFGYYENTAAMLEKYPYINEYWEDKMTRIEEIEVPAYVVASYVSKVHTRGTFDAWSRLKVEDKWLRVHNTHEWPDLYEYQEDLKKFFDCYLKGIDNDWKETPKVRLSVLNPGGKDVVNRIEQDFPMPDTIYKNFYLDAEDNTLKTEPPAEEKFAEFCTDNRRDKVVFDYEVINGMETTGFFGAHLYVASKNNDDIDLFVYALKTDQEGNLLPIIVHGAPFSGFEGCPHYTPNGRLRVSHRELDLKKSTESQPVLLHKRSLKIKPGEVVRVDIPLWPAGVKYEDKQKLRFIVSGYELNKEEWPDMPPAATVNRGNAVIYTGGQHASYLTVPVIPDRERR